MTASNKSLHFMYLNVCGLKAKLNIPEFNELIQSFDVITCAKTKLDELDVVNIRNYACIRKDRMKRLQEGQVV